MERSWRYTIVGLILWIVFYSLLLVSGLQNSSFFYDILNGLFLQIFLVLLPGLIIGLIFYDIGKIKKDKERKRSLLISIVIIIVFLIFFKLIYLAAMCKF